MIYSVNFMDLTEKINPHAVVRYLKDTGWMQYKTKKEYIKIFQKITEKEEFYQVIIPIDKTLADYKKAMFDAIEQIAFLEGQSTEQLMLYLLNPNTDILKIRLQKKDVEAGILLNRECDEYREKIRSLEKAMCELGDPVFTPSPEERICSECSADLPEDILKRVHTVRIEPDGAVTMYLNEE